MNPHDRGGRSPDGTRSQAALTGPPPNLPSIEPPDLAPSLDMAFDGGSLYALRSAVEAHAVQAGMPHGRTDDVVICVHELATNAIRHGAGSGRARMWRLPGQLRCQVLDEGPPAMDEADPSVRFSAPDAMNGRAAPRPGEPGTPVTGGENRPEPEDDRAFRRQTEERDKPRPANEPKTSGFPNGHLPDQWPYRTGHGLWLIRCAADALSIRSGKDGTGVVLTFTLPEPGPRPRFRLTRHLLHDAEHASRRRVVLTATGDLDRQGGAELLDAATDLLAGHSAGLIVDLRSVTFWDTAGVAAMTTLMRRVQERPPAALSMRAGPGSLRECLRYVGLGDALTHADAVDPNDREP